MLRPVGEARRSWLGRLWDRLFKRKSSTTAALPAPRGAPASIPPAPTTLVARVSAVEEAREREMMRLAEESIRRGHPGQAAIVYQKAAARFRREGKPQKELASLNLWARVAPHDPQVWVALADHHQAAEHAKPALEALARAAALWRSAGDEGQAQALEARMEDLRIGVQARARRPAGFTIESSPSSSGERSALPPEPAAPEPSVPPDNVPVKLPPAIAAAPQSSDSEPLELDIPDSGVHDAIEDEAAALMAPAAPRAPTQPFPDPDEAPERLPTGALQALGGGVSGVTQDEVPARLPTGAMQALEDEEDLSDSDLDGLDDDLDDEPEPLSAGALEEVHDEPETWRPPIEDSETEPSGSYDATIAALNVEAVQAAKAAQEAARAAAPDTDDEISPELMAELTRMADEDVTGEEGAATIAMPALGTAAKRGLGIPDAATTMDPSGFTAPPTEEAGTDDLPEIDDEYENQDATRGYSAQELEELDRYLREKGRRR